MVSVRPRIESPEHALVLGALLAHLSEHGVAAQALTSHSERLPVPGTGIVLEPVHELSAELTIDLPPGCGAQHVHVVLLSPHHPPGDPPESDTDVTGAKPAA